MFQIQNWDNSKISALKKKKLKKLKFLDRTSISKYIKKSRFKPKKRNKSSKFKKSLKKHQVTESSQCENTHYPNSFDVEKDIKEHEVIEIALPSVRKIEPSFSKSIDHYVNSSFR